ncbi:hypothetical protein GCM10011351_29710 [Paraliobacillus quinghaiensis]|uniref:DUF2680 domain-containing protein n=1 Tax=Paraliobacillus quinghaiensis TaxID=470815 RepID=A0A917TYF5_9BACI|nr:DUF2680 domain-containing protein [Paraliobacillus quinghaiensis]GGM41630.1 hypothetical protein GCM10011351_29710 [Paraliobacillus quinghaiensis]
MNLRTGLLALVFSVIMIGSGILTVGAEPDHHHKPKFQDVELNEEQMKELKIRYEDLINQRKGIIEKYKEFGVLSEEDATKMQEYLDLYLEKLESDGFIPKWGERKHRHQ